MYPKNESFIILLRLFFSLFLVTSISGTLLWLLTWNSQLEANPNCPKPYLTTRKSERRSLGEEILLTSETNPDKELGVKAFADCDFEIAITKLKSSLRNTPNDPEARIYLHNARAANREILKIAVSVPTETNPDVARKILRGVAQAQEEVNSEQGGINGALLLVEISTDDGDKEIVEKTAQELVEDASIVAVIGDNPDLASFAAEEKLVTLLPTSKLSKLSKNSKYSFRTTPNTKLLAETLARHVDTKLNKVMICADSKNTESQSFQEEFTRALVALEGRVANFKCDLSASNFDSDAIVSQAISSRLYGMVLLPSYQTFDQALAIAKAAGRFFKLFGNDVLYTFKTLEAGQAIKGIDLVVPWHPKAVSQKDFVDNARQLWGEEVNWQTAMTYDATMAVIAGLEQGKSREELQKALTQEDFSVRGAIGKFKFEESGERQVEAYLVRVEANPKASNNTGYEFLLLR